MSLTGLVQAYDDLQELRRPAEVTHRAAVAAKRIASQSLEPPKPNDDTGSPPAMELVGQRWLKFKGLLYWGIHRWLRIDGSDGGHHGIMYEHMVSVYLG